MTNMVFLKQNIFVRKSVPSNFHVWFSNYKGVLFGKIGVYVSKLSGLWIVFLLVVKVSLLSDRLSMNGVSLLSVFIHFDKPFHKLV